MTKNKGRKVQMDIGQKRALDVEMSQ